MTIVEFFDPRNGEHLKAWRVAVAESLRLGLNVNHLSVRFARQCGIDDNDYDWPDDWAQLIIAKMANAWLEDNIPPPFVAAPQTMRRRMKLAPR